jgi:hypothetical protein
MDFEIEGDDDLGFEKKWSKPTKGGGSFGFGKGGGATDDPYDYDFGGVETETLYSSPGDKRGGFSDPYQSKSKASEPAYSIKSKVPEPAITQVKTSITSDNALEKAQSMLNKYSSNKKPTAPAKKSYMSSDFNEDDISIGSDDISGSGADFLESPIQSKQIKPKTAGKSAKASGLPNYQVI